MQIFEVLADPVRREIVELLAARPRTAGELAEAFEISRPAVSRHLRVLREGGVIGFRAEAQRRIYHLEGRALDEAQAWLARCRAFWEKRLDALGDELARHPQSQETTEDRRTPDVGSGNDRTDR